LTCRRAQLRYREKQRQQRDDDRRTIEELSARVAALETQSAELARRNQLLTSVAAIKEAQNPVQPQTANDMVSVFVFVVTPCHALNACQSLDGETLIGRKGSISKKWPAAHQ